MTRITLMEEGTLYSWHSCYSWLKNACQENEMLHLCSAKDEVRTVSTGEFRIGSAISAPLSRISHERQEARNANIENSKRGKHLDSQNCDLNKLSAMGRPDHAKQTQSGASNQEAGGAMWERTGRARAQNKPQYLGRAVRNKPNSRGVISRGQRRHRAKQSQFGPPRWSCAWEGTEKNALRRHYKLAWCAKQSQFAGGAHER